jgi:hypothetical protein
LGATLATRLYAVCQSAHMIRVHDVKAFHRELRTWEAIEAPTSDSLSGAGPPGSHPSWFQAPLFNPRQSWKYCRTMINVMGEYAQFA